ncbi:hypothetical protein HEK616_11210 [Streptomyces nigrescens]|uniref:DUF4383 domain-containing protein n=1 Tax=Streptomyces nigrescens TaxID=1920 RepID=A0ABN6QN67_STRNI|nr:DUF4383 domain-containing protein [Streptomyces nigrescens]BDM67634.1 hypothetical protein HEK616_11210 [Streptomyces nigrescens]
MATGAPGQALPGGRFHRAKRHTRLDEHLPVDHGLSRVYRIGAGVMGLILLAFGVLGLTHNIGFFDTGGDMVAGLQTNGALSVLSIVVGVILFAGMVIGGNFASNLNLIFGILFLLSGFVNLALLQTDANFLAFKIQNVLFSFVVGLMLMVFGMYGRVSGGLPSDNPYWRARHPEEAERFDRGEWHPVSGMTAGRQAMLVKIQGASHAGRGSFGPGTSGSGIRRSTATEAHGPAGGGDSSGSGRGSTSGTGPGASGRSSGTSGSSRAGGASGSGGNEP